MSRLSVHRDLARALDPVELAKDLSLDLDPWQRDVVRSRAPRLLLNCSRQSGKTTSASVLALHSAIYDPGLILLITPSDRQSKENLHVIENYWRDLSGAPEADVEAKLKLELRNGSRIIALPDSARTVRGFARPKLILVDEAARVKEETVTAIKPMLIAGRSRIVALSTPWTQLGWFFEAWSGDENYQKVKITCEQCPRIDRDELEHQRREMPPIDFRREFYCEFSPVENALFDDQVIQSCISQEVTPLWQATASL